MPSRRLLCGNPDSFAPSLATVITIILILVSLAPTNAQTPTTPENADPPQTAQPSSDEAERDARWAQRNDSEQVRQRAERFTSFLNLGKNFKITGLNGRLELRPIAEAIAAGKHEEALDSFGKYFFKKLRNPRAAGLTIDDLSPYSQGTAGHGKFPQPLWDPSADHAKVVERAEALLKGHAQVGGKDVEIGPPGKVNWYYPLPYGQVSDPANPSTNPNPEVVFGTFFDVLAQAFVITHDERFLDAWVAYLDDWSLNSTYVDRVHPLFIPSKINSSGAGRILKELAAVSAALPPDRQPLPPRVFAQMMQRIFGDYPLLSIAYIRSNCHNWTPFPGGVLLSLIGDEFISSPLFFRESKRRNIEDNAVTQNLRDGSENQQDPWYNDNFSHTLSALLLLDTRDKMDRWREVDWVGDAMEDIYWQNDLRDYLRERVNYQIRLRTPQDELPIVFRGGDKRRAARPDRALSPQAFADPVNAAVLNAARSDRKPPYFGDWFPYGGYYIVRHGWGPNDGYGTMFSSHHAGAYGGYRSRSNNNSFGLAEGGQDLLVDDCIGHYMYPTSPLRVDGRNQFFHAGEGFYKVPGAASHKTYLVRAWTDPAPWRWHESDKFNVMEGVYAGPYLDEKKEKTDRTGGIRDTSHQRLAIYVRGANFWIIVDRLHSGAERDFDLIWRIPLGDDPKAPAFTKDEIIMDEAAQRFGAASARQAKVGVDLRQVSSSPLKYQRKDVAKDPKNNYMPYGRAEVFASWRAAGASQVITVIEPRTGDSKGLADFSPQKSQGIEGFNATASNGQQVRMLSADKGTATLSIGSVTADAELLLLEGEEGGLVMGAKDFKIGGTKVETNDATDFEFRLSGGRLAQLLPIYRPIAPVKIGPERTVFTDEIEVTLASETPGVEIRYTLDGSDPTLLSPRYEKPLRLQNTTMVKARAYRPGMTEEPATTAGTHATPVSRALFSAKNPLEPVAAAGKKPGLRFTYRQDDWKALWLDTSRGEPGAQGVVNDLFDLSLVPLDNPPVGDAPAPRAKPYAVTYEGFLEVPEDGVYTFHAPEELVYPDIDAGYDLRVQVGQMKRRGDPSAREVVPVEWYPSTRLHAFGSWSVALKKGAHPFKVTFLDYRTDAAKQLNVENLRPYIWPGSTPELLITGPGLDRKPIPAAWFKN